MHELISKHFQFRVIPAKAGIRIVITSIIPKTIQISGIRREMTELKSIIQLLAKKRTQIPKYNQKRSPVPTVWTFKVIYEGIFVRIN